MKKEQENKQHNAECQVSQEEYEALVAENEKLIGEVDKLTEEVEKVKGWITEIVTELHKRLPR